MIAIESNHEDLEAAKAENRTGVWYFILTHTSGRRLSPGSEKLFTVTGPWEEARKKAEASAMEYGCVAGKDKHLAGAVHARLSSNNEELDGPRIFKAG